MSSPRKLSVRTPGEIAIPRPMRFDCCNPYLKSKLLIPGYTRSSMPSSLRTIFGWTIKQLSDLSVQFVSLLKTISKLNSKNKS